MKTIFLDVSGATSWGTFCSSDTRVSETWRVVYWVYIIGVNISARTTPK